MLASLPKIIFPNSNNGLNEMTLFHDSFGLSKINFLCKLSTFWHLQGYHKGKISKLNRQEDWEKFKSTCPSVGWSVCLSVCHIFFKRAESYTSMLLIQNSNVSGNINYITKACSETVNGMSRVVKKKFKWQKSIIFSMGRLPLIVGGIFHA